MPNLKELKNRQVSVKATQKITRAMQMVAAAKLNKAKKPSWPKFDEKFLTEDTSNFVIQINGKKRGIINTKININEWVTVKANVKEDFKKFHNLNVKELDGLAIMSDTDNSKMKAIAYYQNIYFSAN